MLNCWWQVVVVRVYRIASTPGRLKTDEAKKETQILQQREEATAVVEGIC